MTEAAALAKLERIPELIERDPDLIRRGRFLTADCLIGIGAIAVYAAFRGGRMTLSHGAAPMRSWRFAIRAEAASWERLWAKLPEPGWHDLLALAKNGNAVIEGDLQPLMANLQYVKDVLTLPRRLAEEAVR